MDTHRNTVETISPELTATFALTSGIAFLMLTLAREHRLMDKVERTRRCAACGVQVPQSRACRCSD